MDPIKTTVSQSSHDYYTISQGPTALQACFHVGPIIFLSVKSVLYIDHLSLCYLLCIIEKTPCTLFEMYMYHEKYENE